MTCIRVGSFEADREVLLKLFQITHGKLWTHRGGWAEVEKVENLDICHGVTTNGAGRVERLELQGVYIDYFPGNNVIGETNASSMVACAIGIFSQLEVRSA